MLSDDFTADLNYLIDYPGKYETVICGTWNIELLVVKDFALSWIHHCSDSLI